MVHVIYDTGLEKKSRTISLGFGRRYLKMDRFPEAFERFERVVDTSRIKSFQQLKLSFESWAGHNWRGTKKQMEGLRQEALEMKLSGTPKEPYVGGKTWKYERVRVRGKLQPGYRDLQTMRFIKKPF